MRKYGDVFYQREHAQAVNGPEFISKELDLWAYGKKVNPDFRSPGKSTDNAFIESFNATVRMECLNED